jgi:hexosaminidase
VYNYNPVPKELNAEQAKYILGGQANVWTEYMKNTRKVEYQIFPRISALSEVLWTEPAKKDWSDFEKRMQTQFNRYKLWGSNVSNAYYSIDAALTPAPNNKGGLQLKLQSKDKTGQITYAVAGKHAAKNYSQPVMPYGRCTDNSSYTKNGSLLDSFTMNIKVNKATGKKITLASPPASGYPGEGAFTLVNGIINEMGLARAKSLLATGVKTCRLLLILEQQTKYQVLLYMQLPPEAAVYMHQKLWRLIILLMEKFTNLSAQPRN